MTKHRLAVVLAAAIVAAACTSAASPDDAPTPTPLGRATAVPTEIASRPATPAERALAAYERYMATTVEAMSDGQAQAGQLTAVAADQAVSHARRRLRANRGDGVVVTGTLTPSATQGDVELGSEGSTATVSDCVLNDLEHVAADDPERVVSEATGWRQPVEATVENRDGRWIVTKVKVPLRDGSGPVPPPPDDPPYLRGPAQGPAPPSCVPPDIAQEAVAGLQAFRNAYDEAIGLGRSGPANPDAAGLALTAVEPQLSGAREFAAALAEEGRAFRGQPDAYDPWAAATTDSDEMVIVYDCVTVGNVGEVDVSATRPPSNQPDAGSKRLDVADLVRDGEAWKVAGVSVIEEGLEECTSPARPD